MLNHTRNKYWRIFFFIFAYLVIYNEYLFNSVGIYGNDNSIIINQYQYLSSLIESISVKSFSNIESDLDILNNGIVIIKSLIDYFLYLISGSFIYSKKIFFSTLVILSVFFVDKIFLKFELNKIVSLLLIIFYLSSFSILDNLIMGWDFVLIQILFAPVLFYSYIMYYEKFSLKYIYIIILINIFLTISIQNTFLCIIIFLIFFILNLKAHKKNLFIFAALILSLSISLLPILINNFFFISSHDLYGNVSNSSITKGINGILRPVFAFKSTSHLSNNFFFHYIASLGPIYKIYFSIVNVLGFAGLILMFKQKFKYRYVCFGIFLIDLFLITLKFESNTRYLTNFLDINFIKNFINLFFIIFRDLARLSAINDFIYIISAGYFISYLFKLFNLDNLIRSNFTLIRLKFVNICFLFFIILFFNQKTTSNFIENYNYETASIMQEKEITQGLYTNYLNNTKYSNFLFLPLYANVKMIDIGLLTKNKSAETLDPFRRFSLKNTFYWRTDKTINLNFTSQINHCNDIYSSEKLNKLIKCLSNIDRLNFGINKSHFDFEEIKLISKLFNLENFYIDFESNDIIIFVKKDYKINFQNYGINILKLSDTKNFVSENFIKFNSSRNFDYHNEKNFFKILLSQYIYVFDLLKFKIGNNTIDKNYQLYYLKKQFFNDLSILVVIIFLILNLKLLFINIIRKQI